jgi:hypothetical protein
MKHFRGSYQPRAERSRNALVGYQEHLGERMATRRDILGMAAGAVAFACESVVAQEERALFWRVETPDGGRGIIFGYARIAAAVAPDVTKDGMRFVENAKRIVLDMQNTEFPEMKVDASLPPLLPKLDAALAGRVRSLLASLHVPAAQLDSLPGFVIAAFLYGEGQSNPVPSVGGAILDRAQALGRPVAAVLEPSDVERLRKPVDIAQIKEINQRIDGATIELLLETRQRVGPIGAYTERLYRERRAEELASFGRTMTDRGIPEPKALFDGEAARRTLLSRLPVALRSQHSDDLAFCFLPIGLLTGPDSVLATLRDHGARTTALA